MKLSSKNSLVRSLRKTARGLWETSIALPYEWLLSRRAWKLCLGLPAIFVTGWIAYCLANGSDKNGAGPVIETLHCSRPTGRRRRQARNSGVVLSSRRHVVGQQLGFAIRPRKIRIQPGATGSSDRDHAKTGTGRSSRIPGGSSIPRTIHADATTPGSCRNGVSLTAGFEGQSAVGRNTNCSGTRDGQTKPIRRSRFHCYRRLSPITRKRTF